MNKNLKYIINYLWIPFYAISLLLLLLSGCDQCNLKHSISNVSNEASFVSDSSILFVGDQNSRVNTTMSIDTLNRIATEEYFQGNYQQALKYITKAYYKAKRQNDDAELANVLNTLGLIQWRLDNNIDAVDCYEEAARLAEKNNLTRLLGLTQINLGLIYKADRNYDQAFRYNTKAINVFRGSNNFRDLGIALNNQGQIFKNLAQNDSAKHYYFQAIENYAKIDFKDGQSATYYNLAELYLRQRIEYSALQYAQKSLALGLEIESKVRTKEAYQKISEIFEYFNHSDSALKYYKLYNQINNNLLLANQSQQLARLQVELSAEVKNLQIQNLKKEQILARNRIEFIGAMLIILVLIIIFFVYRYFSKIKFDKRKLELELYNSKTVLEVKEQELKAYILDLSSKNAIVSKLQDDIAKISTDEEKRSIEITRLLEQKILTEDDWESFKTKFRSIYPEFFVRINQLSITLTEAEIRLLVLIHFELSGKEMARTLGISPQSVRVCKMRLKKKLIASNFESVEVFHSYLVNPHK
ncbi:MAG: tetratricopeptide repeat protein [Bacteroidales bacterium]